MKREILEKYIGKNVEIKIFDGATYEGCLRKTGDKMFKKDANLYLPANRYFMTVDKDSKICSSCLFRLSHVKAIKQLKV